jgi:hypothetical protein
MKSKGSVYSITVRQYKALCAYMIKAGPTLFRYRQEQRHAGFKKKYGRDLGFNTYNS